MAETSTGPDRPKLVLARADPRRRGRQPQPRGRQRRPAGHRQGVRRRPDRAQPGRGRLLARAGRIGALPRRDRRPVRAQADAAAGRRRWRSPPRCWPHARRRSRCCSSPGSSAGSRPGMAYPTTLALITALWSGPARTRSIALWSALGGGDLVARAAARGRAARALLVGLGVPRHAAAGRRRARHGAEARAGPRQRDDRSGRQPRRHPLGGDGRGAGAGDQLRRRSRRGHARARPGARSRSRRGGGVRASASVARRIPLYDLDVAAPPHLLGRRGRRDHRLRLPDGRRCSSASSTCRTCSSYSTLDAGAAILPAALGMVLVAPRSAKLVEARGSRFTLLLGYFFCLLGFLTMLLLWDEGTPTGRSASPTAGRHRGRLCGHPGLALADRLGPGRTRRDGVGDAPTCSAISAARSCSRSSARCSPPATPPRSPRRSPARRTRDKVTDDVQSELDEVVLERRRASPSSTRSTRSRSSPRREARSSTATIGPTWPGSSRSCSAP